MSNLGKVFKCLRKYQLKSTQKYLEQLPINFSASLSVEENRYRLAKIKAIHDTLSPHAERESYSFLEKLNYIGRLIAQLTLTFQPLLKLLRRDTAVLWNDACQEEFDKIKQYLLNRFFLVPPTPG